jgi:hypothetical protein
MLKCLISLARAYLGAGEDLEMGGYIGYDHYSRYVMVYPSSV